MVYDNTPSTGLIEALRHSSHTPTTAVADIIDNSIDAEASEVRLLVRQKSEEGNTRSQLIISDNGNGMDEQTLARALTMGSHDGENGSLGKFGLGLKTSGTTLGQKFTVLTKTDDDTDLLKCVYDPDEFARTKRWQIEIAATTESEDFELFNTFVNDSSGTVILIDDLSRNYTLSSIYQFPNTLRTFLSKTFYMFLTPHDENAAEDAPSTGKIRLYIQDKEVFGLDPLERQLKTTKYLYDGDIVTTKGTFHVTLVDLHEPDKDVFNLTPNPTNQGFYIVRNNRMIMAAEARLFESIWTQKHPSANFLRAEIRYLSDMDEAFQVNHDKCGIKNIEQSVYDKIHQEIKTIISQARRQQGIRNSQKNAESSEDLKKAHEGVERKILEKKNLLDLPNDRKTRRNKTGEKRGTVTPKGTPAKRSGKEPVKTPVGTFKVLARDNGAAGAVFDTEVAQGGFIVYWNIAHPFVRKYVTMDDVGNIDQVQSLDLMLFSLASYLQQLIDERGEEGWVMRDNFIESMSKNLRALTS